MSYRVSFKTSADKALDRLPKPVQTRMAEAARQLTGDPRPQGHRKLSGQRNLYRIRVGEYRMVYSIDDSNRRVVIVIVGHRKDVYRRLGP